MGRQKLARVLYLMFVHCESFPSQKPRAEPKYSMPASMTIRPHIKESAICSLKSCSCSFCTFAVRHACSSACPSLMMLFRAPDCAFAMPCNLQFAHTQLHIMFSSLHHGGRVRHFKLPYLIHLPSSRNLFSSFVRANWLVAMQTLLAEVCVHLICIASEARMYEMSPDKHTNMGDSCMSRDTTIDGPAPTAFELPHTNNLKHRLHCMRYPEQILRYSAY